MLDQLTSQVEKYKKEVEELRTFNQLMSKEQIEMTKRLEGYVKAQETCEEELYSKFALVLNSKKAKIRELKDQLESGKGGSGAKSTKNTTIKEQKRRTVVESEEEEFETDDEKETTSSSKRKLSDEESRSSNKEDEKRTNNDDIRLDDSIVDDDDDLPRRSRKRIRATKPKTPVNSVLPRTTSLPRPKSAQGASSSGQKSTRRQVSREISADELLDNL